MQKEGIRIDPTEAKARADAGEAIILDVVAPHVWEQMHRSVAGAIRLDPREIEHLYQELPRDKQIVAYCT